MAEFQGISIDEFDKMYPDAGQDKPADNSDQNQEPDAIQEPSPADFEDPDGHADGSMQYGDYEPEPEPEPEPKKDIPPVNQKGEYYRKLKEVQAMEAKLKQQGVLESEQQPPATEPPPQQQVELPPQLPPQQQQQWQQQPQQVQPQQQRVPTPEELGFTKPAKVETPEEWQQFINYNTAQQMYQTEQRAEQKAYQRIQQQQTEQQILSDYPDLANPQSPLFQWTQYELNSRYSGDPRFVEEATIRAASRIGIQAKSRQVAPQPQPQQRTLPRVQASPPASERGVQQRTQGPKVKLSPESLRAAKMFGQNTKDIEVMVKRKRYVLSSGAALFEE